MGGPGGGVVPPTPLYRGDVEGTQDISAVAFQNNAWEKSKPGILTFLLGASRGGGGLFHPAQL